MWVITIIMTMVTISDDSCGDNNNNNEVFSYILKHEALVKQNNPKMSKN